MISAPVVLAGAPVGAGVTLVVRSLLPNTPDLAAALDRLDATAAAPSMTAPSSGRFGHAAATVRCPRSCRRSGCAATAATSTSSGRPRRTSQSARSATGCSAWCSPPCWPPR